MAISHTHYTSISAKKLREWPVALAFTFTWCVMAYLILSSISFSLAHLFIHSFIGWTRAWWFSRFVSVANNEMAFVSHSQSVTRTFPQDSRRNKLQMQYGQWSNMACAQLDSTIDITLINLIISLWVQHKSQRSVNFYSLLLSIHSIQSIVYKNFPVSPPFSNSINRFFTLCIVFWHSEERKKNTLNWISFLKNIIPAKQFHLLSNFLPPLHATFSHLLFCSLKFTRMRTLCLRERIENIGFVMWTNKSRKLLQGVFPKKKKRKIW